MASSVGIHKSPLPTISTATPALTYYLQDTFQGQSFFDNFNFMTDAGLNNDYVDGKNQSIAAALGLVGTRSTNETDYAAYIGVDFATNLTWLDSQTATAARGRAAVRLESKKIFNHGLFIADLAHMPGNSCGIWPAFWTSNLDPTVEWPTGGAIDIIEWINEETFNTETMQTVEGCSLEPSAQAVGAFVQSTNCDINANGCSVQALENPNTVGDLFNSHGGGVYVMEWTNATIKIWNFPRDNIPQDITSGHPNPANWTAPTFVAGGSSCNVAEMFFNHTMVIDTTFCGYYADNPYLWSQTTCAAQWPSCNEYVASNPDVFEDAYWLFNSIDVFQTIPPTAITPSNSSVSISNSTGVFPTTSVSVTISTSASSSNSFSTSCSTSTSTPTSALASLSSPVSSSNSSSSNSTIPSSTLSSTSISTSTSVLASISTSASSSNSSSTSSSTSISTSTSASASISSPASSSNSSFINSTISSSTSCSTSISTSTSASASTSSPTSSPTSFSTSSSSSSRSTNSTICASSSHATDTSILSTTSATILSSTSTSVSTNTTMVPNTAASRLPMTSSTMSSVSVISLPISSTNASLVSTTSSSPQITISTVYSTSIYTITSCAATMTDCPARLGSVTTDIISLYTTICPVTAHGVVSAASTYVHAENAASTPSPILTLGISSVSSNKGVSTVSLYIPFSAGSFSRVISSATASVSVSSAVSTTTLVVVAVSSATSSPSGGFVNSTVRVMPTKSSFVPTVASTAILSTTTSIIYATNAAVRISTGSNVAGIVMCLGLGLLL